VTRFGRMSRYETARTTSTAAERLSVGDRPTRRWVSRARRDFDIQFQRKERPISDSPDEHPLANELNSARTSSASAGGEARLARASDRRWRRPLGGFKLKV
jgi:hypothetical protein